MLSVVALLTDISGWVGTLNIALYAPVRLVGTAVLIVLFTFVYTAFVCDPEQMAARLAACGGALPGIAPGEATAAHLDRAISRTAAFGAAYLVVVMLLPELLSIVFRAARSCSPARCDPGPRLRHARSDGGNPARYAHAGNRARHFAGSLRREQVIAAGWQAMPMFEQWTVSPSPRSQLRHVSVHAMQVLSRSP